MDATLLILAVIAISVPSIFNAAIEPDTLKVEELSLTTAAVMLGIYVLSIVYMLRSKAPKRRRSRRHTTDAHGPSLEPRVALGGPGGLVVGIAVMSEFLVGSIEPVTESLGLTAVLRRHHHHPADRQRGRAPGGGTGGARRTRWTSA